MALFLVKLPPMAATLGYGVYWKKKALDSTGSPGTVPCSLTDSFQLKNTHTHSTVKLRNFLDHSFQ
jgi:hypothetical protein